MSIFVPQIKQKGLLEQIEITVCIVGSRKISSKDDYGAGIWSVFAPNLTIIGFDADADACEVAEAHLASKSITWNEKHIPLALSKSIGESTLYVTQGVHCSSLYPPNEPFLKRFHGMRDGIKLDYTFDIETTTLDTFCQEAGIQEIDFLQVDVQGADLDVLQGSIETLKRGVLGVEVEVEFSSLYRNQPLFSDINSYLKKFGFTLFDLVTDDAWCRRPRAISPICSPVRNGQLLWADACYLLDPFIENAQAQINQPQKLLKLACIADVLGFPDYALEILEHLTINYGKNPQYNFAQVIVDTLSQFPNLVEQGLDSLPVVANVTPYLNNVLSV